MVAGFHIADVGTNFLDDTGRFVPQDGWEGRCVEPVYIVKVTMAHPDRRGAYQHFS